MFLMIVYCHLGYLFRLFHRIFAEYLPTYTCRSFVRHIYVENCVNLELL